MWLPVCMGSTLVLWCELEAGPEKCWIAPSTHGAGSQRADGWQLSGRTDGWMTGVQVKFENKSERVFFPPKETITSTYPQIDLDFWQVKMQSSILDISFIDEASWGMFIVFLSFQWEMFAFLATNPFLNVSRAELLLSFFLPDSWSDSETLLVQSFK